MKVGRNDPCPCGSGKKYKRCCLPLDEEREAMAPARGAVVAAHGAPTPAPGGGSAKGYTEAALEREVYVLDPSEPECAVCGGPVYVPELVDAEDFEPEELGELMSAPEGLLVDVGGIKVAVHLTCRSDLKLGRAADLSS